MASLNALVLNNVFSSLDPLILIKERIKERRGSKLKIRDIRPGMEGITLVARVVSVGEPREVETRYGRALVATAIIEDETGRVKLNLWRDQIKIVKPGYLITLENAFARSYMGEIELNIGRRGRITVVRR